MGVDSDVESLAKLMRACGDETRLRLVNLLCAGMELCVYDLVEVTGASQPKVSRHLASLRRVGLVRSRKDGLWVYYRIIDKPDEATALLLDALEHCFGLFPDLGRDLDELQRIKSASAVTRWHQRIPQDLPNVPSASVGPSQSSAPTAILRSDSELEIELL